MYYGIENSPRCRSCEEKDRACTQSTTSRANGCSSCGFSKYACSLKEDDTDYEDITGDSTPDHVQAEEQHVQPSPDEGPSLRRPTFTSINREPSHIRTRETSVISRSRSAGPRRTAPVANMQNMAPRQRVVIEILESPPLSPLSSPPSRSLMANGKQIDLTAERNQNREDILQDRGNLYKLAKEFQQLKDEYGAEIYELRESVSQLKDKHDAEFRELRESISQTGGHINQLMGGCRELTRHISQLRDHIRETDEGLRATKRHLNHCVTVAWGRIPRQA
ncbi:hypothetical protein E4T42_09583 [Aureobasidium subglaciale]|nr:hypothetical protein E4T42_09583 [Aureobasidium subglaciale]